MAPLPEFKFQRNTRVTAKLDKNYSIPDSWYEIDYNDRKLKYTLDIIGDQPPLPSGYPLFIGLHGGGESSALDRDGHGDPIPDGEGGFKKHNTGPTGNDNSWKWVWKQFYRDPIDDFYKKVNTNTSAKDVDRSAVYVALRGVSAGVRTGYKFTDTYDLHSQPESYVLLERLISHLINLNPPELDQHDQGPNYKALLTKIPSLKHFIDPNKVYLMGFSAGGNGAFELGTRISDRFAAVVPAAGHPESVKFENVANVPLLLEVGEDDCYNQWPPKGMNYNVNQDGYFQRAAVYLENVVKPLKNLIGTQPQPGHYQYDCYVVKNSDRPNENNNPHNFWAFSPETYTKEQKTLKPTKFEDWLKKYNPAPGDDSKRLAFPTFDDVNTYYDNTIVSPIPWLNGKTRNPTPPFIAWNLLNRPTKPEKASSDMTWEEKRYFYWLYLRKTSEQFEDLRKALNENKASYKPEQAWLDPAANAIHIPNPNEYMGYLLKESMLNFTNIKVFAQPAPPQTPTITLHSNQAIKDATLAARGDPELQFSAMFYLVKDNNGHWIPKEAQTMDG